MGVPKADSCSCMTEKHKNFTSSPIWFPSISFSSLIVVCRTSRTILNNCGKSGHPFLIPDLRGKAFSFPPLRIMFAVGFSYMAFTMLRKVSSRPFFEAFLS